MCNSTNSTTILPRKHKVGVALYENVIFGDVFIATEFFSRASDFENQCLYEVQVCSTRSQIANNGVMMSIDSPIEDLKYCDTIVLPGLDNVTEPIDQHLLDTILDCHRRGIRIVSTCTGSFVLAATGLLNGMQATTHWSFSQLLQDMYPNINVAPDALFADNGQVLTSAGFITAVDLFIHIVKRDHGSAVGRRASKDAMYVLERSGHSKQFIETVGERLSENNLYKLLTWIKEHLHRPLTLKDLAQKATVSERTLSRKFLAETGESPNQWLLNARIDAAQALLENSDLNVDQIAYKTGFGTPSNFRARFKNKTGLTPSQYRKGFTTVPHQTL